jgi:hypothetical protein
LDGILDETKELLLHAVFPLWLMASQKVVMPAKAGIQSLIKS